LTYADNYHVRTAVCQTAVDKSEHQERWTAGRSLKERCLRARDVLTTANATYYRVELGRYIEISQIYRRIRYYRYRVVIGVLDIGYFRYVDIVPVTATISLIFDTFLYYS